MFASPVKADSPLDPATCRKRLQTILAHAGCKKVRFHDLRHLFVTTALESGMDVKTLSTMIGHVSVSTTLNVYTHVTDDTQRTAAAKIDSGIGKCEHLWEGKYSPTWPDGKKHSRNVYASSSEECEVKLADLIINMKAEIAEAGELDGAAALAAKKKARGTRNARIDTV